MGGRLYASWVRLRQSSFPPVQPVDLCHAEGSSGRISQWRLSPSLQEPFPLLLLCEPRVVPGDKVHKSECGVFLRMQTSAVACFHTSSHSASSNFSKVTCRY